MKKFYLLILFCSIVKTSFAADDFPIPNDFEITQYWFSFTTSFDISHQQQKIASLHRRALTPILTYDFYDEHDQKLAKAKMRIFSYRAQFDVYDRNNQSIGSIKENLFRFFPSFSLYSNDGTKLAEACLNFWGTTFTIYDTLTHAEIANMQRSLFRIKNDWEVHITNRSLYDARQINPVLFLTALAFQGDLESWEQTNSQNQHIYQNTPPLNLNKIHPDLIENWAKRWDQQFTTTYPDYYLQDPELNLKHMLKLGLELQHTPNLSAEDKQTLQALFQFIQQTGEN